MLHAQPAGVAPPEPPAVPEDRLDAVVVQIGLKAEGVRAPRLGPVVRPTGERACLVMDITLAIAAALSEREQLHHLPAVVLVGAVAVVLHAVEPQQHRRVSRHLDEQIVKAPQPAGAHHGVLAQHQPLRGAVDRGRKPAVPDERHPLLQRLVGADHAVEPPAVVIAPHLRGVQGTSAGAVGRAAGQPCRTRWTGERGNGAVEAQRLQTGHITRARAKARPPQQPGRIRGAETATQGGDRGAWQRRHDGRGDVVAPFE